MSDLLTQIERKGAVEFANESTPLAGVWKLPFILNKSNNEMDGFFIYVIWDDCSDPPVYVGMTSKGFKRIREHFTFNKEGRNSYYSPIGYLLKIVTERGAWQNWRVSFLGPFSSRSNALSSERSIDRYLHPWHSSGPSSWMKGLDYKGREPYPWYICEFLHRTSLSYAAWKIDQRKRRTEYIMRRLEGGHDLYLIQP